LSDFEAQSESIKRKFSALINDQPMNEEYLQDSKVKEIEALQ
jgi:hypothetical protein